MKSITGWNAPNTGATNESGFTGLPGGTRVNSGAYGAMGLYAYWWSSTERNAGDTWSRDLYFYFSSLDRNSHVKQSGLNVRCVRD